MKFLKVKTKKKRPFWQKKAAHLILGKKGEDLACRLLEELGIKIVTRNYRNETGEIDIVACDDDVLCFIEVKTRSNSYLFEPRDAVNAHKRKLIRATAIHYLKFLPGRCRPKFRFDIIEVIRRGTRFETIRYWRNAFHTE